MFHWPENNLKACYNSANANNLIRMLDRTRIDRRHDTSCVNETG